MVSGLLSAVTMCHEGAARFQAECWVHLLLCEKEEPRLLFRFTHIHKRQRVTARYHFPLLITLLFALVCSALTSGAEIPA